MKKKINKSLVGIILASGSGNRMKSSTPKQYLLINKISLLETNIEKFLLLPYISLLIVVINKKHLNFFKDIKKKYKNVLFIEGGHSRQESTFCALNYLKKYNLIYEREIQFFPKINIRLRSNKDFVIFILKFFTFRIIIYANYS